MTSRTGLEPQALQVGKVALEIFHGEVFVHPMGLQEAVDLVASFKAKQAPQIWLIEMAYPVFFRQKGLQYTAGEIVAKAFGDVIGYVDGEFHTLPYAIRVTWSINSLRQKSIRTAC